MRGPAVARPGPAGNGAGAGNSCQAERVPDTRTGIPHGVCWLSEAGKV